MVASSDKEPFCGVAPFFDVVRTTFRKALEVIGGEYQARPWRVAIATPRQRFLVTLRKMSGGGRKACSKGRSTVPLCGTAVLCWED